MDANRKGSSRKVSQDVRKDRKSATGMSGEPKKGGHGGKFTWSGGQGYGADDAGMENGAVDTKDPNFEDPKHEEEEEERQL